MSWHRWDGDDLLLDLLVQPRASRDEFAEPLGDFLKIRITSPPVDGKANQHLQRFLASAFGVPRARVVLVRGANARRKTLRIIRPASIPSPLESAIR